MKNCDQIREILGAWRDGELDGAAAEAVRAHVEECSGCREEQRQLDNLESSLKSFLASQPPTAFEPLWREVERRIAEKRSWRLEWTERVRAFFGRPNLAWGIPALIGLALVLYSLGVWKDQTPRNNFAAVESIDTYGRNVALLRENETRTTVIWLYQNQEGDNETSGETSDQSPTF